MAIDTREERQAIVALGLPWLGPNTTPNAAADGEWRQETTYGYPGILVGGAGPAAAVRQLPMMGIG